MSFARNTLVPILILALLLTACGSAVATSTPVDANSISTSLVGTLVFSLFQTQTALVPPPSPVPSNVPPTPANTFIFPTPNVPTQTLVYYYPTLTPNRTPTVTGTLPTATINADSLAFGCNNLAFVRDVTIPSGTVLDPNQDFVKTWKVANTGTCDWVYQYQLKLLSGDAYNGKTLKLGRVVTAGHWTELSIGLGAPRNPGTYTSYWRMADANGNMFGASLAVSFIVGSPTNVPSTNTSVPASTNTPSNTPTDTPTPTNTP